MASIKKPGLFQAELGDLNLVILAADKNQTRRFRVKNIELSTPMHSIGKVEGSGTGLMQV
jgi:hypothetical protein